MRIETFVHLDHAEVLEALKDAAARKADKNPMLASEVSIVSFELERGSSTTRPVDELRVRVAFTEV